MNPVVAILALIIGILVVRARAKEKAEEEKVILEPVPYIPPVEAPTYTIGPVTAILFVPPVVKPKVDVHFVWADRPWFSFDQIPTVPIDARLGQLLTGYLTVTNKTTLNNEYAPLTAKIIVQCDGKEIFTATWGMGSYMDNWSKVDFVAPSMAGYYPITVTVTTNSEVIFDGQVNQVNTKTAIWWVLKEAKEAL